ncbi:MAG: uncharacterized protein QG658_597 [Patescibacteria group bacterium]|nr:uncharacterized protein [Patescibacteria group bacterium]
MAEHDKDFIEYVVKNIVDYPDDVQLERTIDDRGVLLTLSVNPEDMGKIIGKAGGTAKAIRTLLRVLGAKDDARYNLKIVDPEGSERANAAAQRDESQDQDEAPADEPEQTEDVPTEEASSDEDDVEAIKKKAREGLDDLDMDI